MKSSNIKYAITLAVLILLGILGLHWHNENVKESIKTAISEKEGQIQLLKNQVGVLEKEASHLKIVADNALKNLKVDTITLYLDHYEKLNYVNSLGIDSGIVFFTKHLAKANFNLE